VTIQTIIPLLEETHVYIYLLQNKKFLIVQDTCGEGVYLDKTQVAELIEDFKRLLGEMK